MKKILVADDEPAFVDLVKEKLTASGYSVTGTLGGNEALAALRAERPDLIIADLNMPLMTGFELSQSVKADPQYRQIPMILLSGLVAEDAEAEGLQEGDFYMAKPLDLKRLLAKIKELLNEDESAGRA